MFQKWKNSVDVHGPQDRSHAATSVLGSCQNTGNHSVLVPLFQPHLTQMSNNQLLLPQTSCLKTLKQCGGFVACQRGCAALQSSFALKAGHQGQIQLQRPQNWLLKVTIHAHYLAEVWHNVCSSSKGLQCKGILISGLSQFVN